MENLTLVSPKPVLTLTTSPNPTLISTKQCFGLPLLPSKPTGSLFVSKPRSRTVLFALSNPNSVRTSDNSTTHGKKTIGVELFARISKASNAKATAQETTSVGVNPQPYVAPPYSQFGSPLFWIGVGIGFSALFSFISSRLKQYAMQQIFKNVMGQMGSQNNQFSNAAFPSGSPFGVPPQSTPGPSNFSGFPYQPPTPSRQSTSSAIPAYTYKPPSTSNVSASYAPPQTPPPPAAPVKTDVSGTKSEAAEPIVNGDANAKTEAKKSAFVDVSPEETVESSPFENYDDTSSSMSSEPAKFAEVVQNGSASKEGTSSDWSQSATRKSGSLLSVDTLEKLMEDPEMQKMIYPHLPEEMRNPTTFKWMLQNPLYRQQLQEMLDNMGGGAVDSSLMENLKNFDLNSPEVKQQFDQIGITPEEAISKIMANPDIAMAFQNPRIQQALMDCSQNPMNIVKYQNDKEVMDVFNKIQQLFPGAGGF